MDRSPPSIFELTPLNPTYRDAPHRLLDDLRARRPAHADLVAGTTILTRYADVRGVEGSRS